MCCILHRNEFCSNYIFLLLINFLVFINMVKLTVIKPTLKRNLIINSILAKGGIATIKFNAKAKVYKFQTRVKLIC